MKNIYSLLSAVLIVSLQACNDDKDLLKQDEGNVISCITVSLAARADNDNDDDSSESVPDQEKENQSSAIDPFEMPFTLDFDKNSVIFVSQQTTQTAPFKTADAIYPYAYKEDYDDIADPDNDWYDDNIYNFTPISDNPLEWYKIGNTGSYLSGFYLYALHFPRQSQITQREENGNIIYNVQNDQSSLDNLIKSDILGAFHSSPTLFSRLTFRLFHLMTYVGIRLYVPVFDPVTKTGYYDNALIAANLENVTPEFAIQWNHVISADTEGPKIKAFQGTEKIKMYQHPLKDTESSRTIADIDCGDFLPEGYFDQQLPDNIDHVRVYDFSVLMPMQDNFDVGGGNSGTTDYPDFMSFVLRSNSGAENIYYFNQSMIKDAEENQLQLDQGAFQYLELYVPRVGNRVVYAGSNLKPWLDHSTSFPLKDDM